MDNQSKSKRIKHNSLTCVFSGGERMVSWFGGKVGSLPTNKSFFAYITPSIVTRGADLANNTVTGNEKGYRVDSECPANRTGGRRRSNGMCNLTIGTEKARRYPKKSFPNIDLKVRSFNH